MEISLLLSAAQSVPVDSRPRAQTQPCYASSPVSHYTSSRSTDLQSTDHYQRRSDLINHPVQLPSFSHLTNPPPDASSGAHRGRVEKNSLKPFHCAVEGCQATFGQKGSLTRHVRSRHEKLRPHTCDLCQKSFSALWTLRVHQRNVHLKSKPHKCHLCDKSFGELFNKSKHIAIVHEGKRPFSCPICSRAFGYKGDMRKHVLELHEQSGRPFQCMVPSCGVKFARKRYLRRHENLSHKGNPLVASVGSPISPNASSSFGSDTNQPRSSRFYLGSPGSPREGSKSTRDGMMEHGAGRSADGQHSVTELQERY